MFLFPEKYPFGLDISDNSLRLAQIKKYGKKLRVVSFNELMLPEGIMEMGDIKNADLLTENIKKLIATAKGKKVQSKHVVAVLPETKTFIKLLKIYVEDLETLPKVLAQEMTKHIPFAINEIYFDWQSIGTFRPKHENEILVGAAPIEVVDAYIAVIKNADLIPLALEIEAAAISRSILPLNGNEHEWGSIIIDMGASRSSLIVYDKNAVQFTMSLPLSGNDITKKISQKLEIEYKKAEAAKILCGLDDEKCRGALKKILYSSIDNLIAKIEEAMRFYEETAGNGAIKKFILSGGGSQLIGLDRVLTEKFNIPTERGNPLLHIADMENASMFSKRKLQSFTTAIGLALR